MPSKVISWSKLSVSVLVIVIVTQWSLDMTSTIDPDPETMMWRIVFICCHCNLCYCYNLARHLVVVWLVFTTLKIKNDILWITLRNVQFVFKAFGFMLLFYSHARDQGSLGEHQLLLGGSSGGNGETESQSDRWASLSVQHPVRPCLHQWSCVTHM